MANWMMSIKPIGESEASLPTVPFNDENVQVWLESLDLDEINVVQIYYADGSHFKFVKREGKGQPSSDRDDLSLKGK